MATDFEGYTHEQLLAMIASLDSETVVARATQLQGAAVAIKDIGESLRKHQVKGWEGVAADEFQKWVTQAGNATLRLADYSQEGSKWMTHAAQTMVEVKANTPKYDTSAAANLAAAQEFHNDPDAQQLGQTAHSKLSGDRHEAIQQLTKLAQSYDTSATQMNKAEIPTFSPPPPEFEPRKEFGSSDLQRSGGASTGGGGGGEAFYGASVQGAGTSQNASDGVPSGPIVPGATSSSGSGAHPALPLPDRPVDVGLDGVSVLPDKIVPLSPGVSGEVAQAGTSWAGTPGHLIQPVTLPPVGNVPLPNGALPGPKPVSGGLGGKVGGVLGLPPRDSGIVGGRPVSSGSPGAALPRGNVIGAEGTQGISGRGVGGGMGSGITGPHGPSGGSSVVGRRLAMEPGGVVGGRQPVGGGRPVTGGQPFTQGGSGLVRGSGSGMVGGAMGHGGAGTRTPGNRPGRQGSARPDYLAEDEETWQGDRRVVPPVVD
ncbi:WXG100 family type VII secretion target [Streptomyces sp. NPDC059104]|uniref:WXG100 family type VII secretion target n=1 Tax=Streptomyces sp. NPDC059104 TaxID=3346729 RepID=UPI0036A56D37